MNLSPTTKWIVAALVGIAVIAAGIYFFTRPKTETSSSDIMDEAILKDIRQVSAGTSVADIQTDINATDLQSLDDELESLNQEIQGL